MELCNQFRVHGLSSLYVTGIDEAYSDDDITEFFKVNGDIKKVVRVPDDPEQPRGRALIEYTAERVISRLDPRQLESKENIESLLSPAADIVKPLGTNATPQAYLTQLESAFGVVEDGEELFATFLGSNQNSDSTSNIGLDEANGDADGLSRRPQAAPQEDYEYLQEKERINSMTKRLIEGEIPSDAVSAVCQRHSVTMRLPVLAESLVVDASSLPDLFIDTGQNTVPGMTKENWHEAQIKDPSIGKVVTLVKKRQKPHFKSVKAESPEVKLLLREWNKLELIDDVLYRKCFDRGNKIHQLVLPEEFRERALKGFTMSRLHSDQGRDFESHTIKELCSLIGAEKVRTTPYHPQGNPVERFNRTLISMLGTLDEEDKHHWRDFVRPVVHAYNCTRNDATGYSPYELMFGRQPMLPVDLILGLKPPTETHTTHSEYVQNLRQRLKESYALAAENSKV
ncbi:hypothetical protein DPEC_G00097630 [Dallia pectoralis]|uniref:Uncharacterized protein n=1 Tax=Dallia pectoralis TaxID=75939 RepID=A0ACC2GVJ9_DALPE|nr:hypothetical protein DPEC_G00097630 [Dallia pectoralis]